MIVLRNIRKHDTVVEFDYSETSNSEVIAHVVFDFVKREVINKDEIDGKAYRSKAIVGIETLIDNNVFPNEYIVAWC